MSESRLGSQPVADANAALSRYRALIRVSEALRSYDDPDALFQSLALELAPYGIRANVVEPGFSPGSTFTELKEDYVNKMTARIPLGRVSGPNDAPHAILYLCSDHASYITGAVLSVDGGNSMRQ